MCPSTMDVHHQDTLPRVTPVVQGSKINRSARISPFSRYLVFVGCFWAAKPESKLGLLLAWPNVRVKCWSWVQCKLVAGAVRVNSDF